MQAKVYMVERICFRNGEQVWTPINQAGTGLFSGAKPHAQDVYGVMKARFPGQRYRIAVYYRKVK